jgi:sulfur-oxidizing protein SoxY
LIQIFQFVQTVHFFEFLKEPCMSTRRETLKQSAVLAGLLAGTGLFPSYAFAFNNAAFDAKNLGDALKALGAGAPQASKDVTLTAPDIAENGAVVPMGAATTLAGVKQLLLLVEKNPSALVAVFNVTDSIEANMTTRAKMGQSSDVYAVAIMNDGKAFFAKKEVKVTLGGCGG